MSANAAHIVTRILIVTALVFASGCAAVSADGLGVSDPATGSGTRHRDAERIQLRMNRHAERVPAIYR